MPTKIKVTPQQEKMLSDGLAIRGSSLTLRPVPGFPLVFCDTTGQLYEDTGNDVMRKINPVKGRNASSGLQAKIPVPATIPLTSEDLEMIERVGVEAVKKELARRSTKKKYLQRTYARLVCAAHHGPEPFVPFVGPNEFIKWVPVRHRDKDKNNMHPDNLYWDVEWASPKSSIARLKVRLANTDDEIVAAAVAARITQLEERLAEYNKNS